MVVKKEPTLFHGKFLAFKRSVKVEFFSVKVSPVYYNLAGNSKSNKYSRKNAEKHRLDQERRRQADEKKRAEQV